jgi:hypothetical protein
MPYIVRFRWQDLLSQKNYIENLRDPEFKEAVNKGFGAYYHPRFMTAKVIKPTVSKGKFAIVEFKGKISNKKDVPEYIDDVLKHLGSWGIKDVEVYDPEQITATEFAMREPRHEEYKYSFEEDRKKKSAKPKPKRKIVKKCKCK